MLLFRYLGYVKDRSLRFLTKEQLVVPAVLAICFGIWQWKTGIFHSLSVEGACRSLWPYVVTAIVCWCWQCKEASRDLNAWLTSPTSNSQPVLYSHDQKPIPNRKASTLTGPLLATASCLPAVIIFLSVTYCGLLWVQPWNVAPSVPRPPEENKPIGRAPGAINSKSDPSVELLDQAETFYDRLYTWHHNSIQERLRRLAEAESDEKALGQQAINSKKQWVWGIWWQETLTEYQQTYAPEAIRLRREIILQLPEAASIGARDDWMNPGVSGGITGYEAEFSELLETYRQHLRKVGKHLKQPSIQEASGQPVHTVPNRIE